MEDDHCPPDDPASKHDMFPANILIPPPMYPEDIDPLPDSILFDPIGYISDRTNGTTAGAFTKGGRRIEVTFWVAHPPRASYFSVHSAAGLEIDDHPAIVATEKDLALLRVPICHPNCNSNNSTGSDYFVYEAGTKPTLRLVAMPRYLSIPDSSVGLLRFRRRGMFFITILCWTFTIGQYDLHLYTSETNSWSKRLMHIDSPEAAKNYTYASKIISIGGEQGSMAGLVAWVDLWNGILICDLLQDSQILQYIPLPSPRVPTLRGGSPLHVRDINVVGGYIMYFEMCLYVGLDLEEGWEGATSRMKVSRTETEWEEGCRIKVCSDPTSSRVPPNLQEGTVLKEPVLKGRHAGFPAISLHDDDVVYIMDKHKFLDKKASVVAVDMKNQTVKGAADFVSGVFFGLTQVYIPSGISRYMGGP
jgi:hypothetical protein